MHPLDKLHAELAEIDENIQRHNLTAIQEAKALARRKELYEAMHPETKKPGRGKNQYTPTEKTSVGTFAEDTASKIGKTSRTVRNAVELGQKITDAAAVQIHGTAVSSATEKISFAEDTASKIGKTSRTVRNAVGRNSMRQCTRRRNTGETARAPMQDQVENISTRKTLPKTPPPRSARLLARFAVPSNSARRSPTPRPSRFTGRP